MKKKKKKKKKVKMQLKKNRMPFLLATVLYNRRRTQD